MSVVKSAKNEKPVLTRNKRHLVWFSSVVIAYGLVELMLQSNPLPEKAGDKFKKPIHLTKENQLKISIKKKYISKTNIL